MLCQLPSATTDECTLLLPLCAHMSDGSVVCTQLQARRAELAAATKAAAAVGPLRSELDAARAELRAAQRARSAEQRELAELRAAGPSAHPGRAGPQRMRELEARLDEREQRLRELRTEVWLRAAARSLFTCGSHLVAAE